MRLLEFLFWRTKSESGGGGEVTTDERFQHHDFIELPLRTKARIYEKCAPLYKEGLSLSAIEEKTGIARTTIRAALKENGFALRDPIDANRADPNNKNRKHSGGIPYGWACLDGKLIVDAKEQRVIREIMKLHKEGKSNLAIAKNLNVKKVPTRLNGTWRDSTVRLIIKRHKDNLT